MLKLNIWALRYTIMTIATAYIPNADLMRTANHPNIRPNIRVNHEVVNGRQSDDNLITFFAFVLSWLIIFAAQAFSGVL